MEKEIINATFSIWIKEDNFSKLCEYLCVDQKYIEEAFFYDHKYDVGFINNDLYVKDIVYPFTYTYNTKGFWNTLASCIEDGSFIIWSDEEGYSWRFDFIEGLMIESNKI